MSGLPYFVIAKRGFAGVEGNSWAKNKEDEIDALIELTSYRNGYWVLSIGVWFLLIQLLYVGSGGWYDILENSSPSFISHLLLLFFVLAEVTNFITQLYHYRKGI